MACLNAEWSFKHYITDTHFLFISITYVRLKHRVHNIVHSVFVHYVVVHCTVAHPCMRFHNSFSSTFSNIAMLQPMDELARLRWLLLKCELYFCVWFSVSVFIMNKVAKYILFILYLDEVRPFNHAQHSFKTDFIILNYFFPSFFPFFSFLRFYLKNFFFHFLLKTTFITIKT